MKDMEDKIREVMRTKPEEQIKEVLGKMRDIPFADEDFSRARKFLTSAMLPSNIKSVFAAGMAIKVSLMIEEELENMSDDMSEKCKACGICYDDEGNLKPDIGSGIS